MIAVIGAPTSAGAFAPGQEDAPGALSAAGLVAALGASDRGDTPRFRWRVDHDAPRAMNADAVVDGVRAVAARVEEALRAGDLPLVLGGDCTVGVGTVAGAVAAGAEPRLVYLDLHPDLNTPGSVPDGALDWMGVAHMLDVEGADERLAAAGPRAPAAGRRRPRAARRRARAVHRRRARGDRRPRPAADRRRRRCAPIPAAPRAPRSSAPRPAAGASSCTSTSTSIDFSDVPLSENTGRGIGVPLRRGAGRARRPARRTTRCSALTVTELNPHHGAQDGADVARLAQALAGALARA